MTPPVGGSAAGGCLPCAPAREVRVRLGADALGVEAEYLETGAAIPAAKERELRLADAELELRLGNDLERAEELLAGLLEEHVPDGLAARIRATLGALLDRKSVV